MKIVVQRVESASVSVGKELIGSIKHGLLLLIGISQGDNQEDIDWLSNKIINMRIFNDDQDKIYYCVADTHEAAANSPHIEGLKADKKEVLLLTDRIDEWLMATLMNFKGKELVNVAKDINVDEEKPNISDSDQDFLTKVKNTLDDKISDVVVSTRLVDSATCLRLPNNEPGAQLRKILEASGQTLGDFKPILEVNLKHKLLKKLQGLDNKEFNAFVEFLYDYAVIAEGGSPKDPSKYLRQLDKYLS